jgi:hypothetical protein
VRRPVLILGGAFFVCFAVAAFVIRRVDASQTVLSIVGGALAYAFLMGVVIVWIVRRRRGAAAAERAVADYLTRHPRVAATVGRPVSVGGAEAGGRLSSTPGQANLLVPVWGPRGEATADLVMARLDRGWEVLAAELDWHGERVPLSGVSGVGSP